jgi:hypothetical protein
MSPFGQRALKLVALGNPFMWPPQSDEDGTSYGCPSPHCFLFSSQTSPHHPQPHIPIPHPRQRIHSPLRSPLLINELIHLIITRHVFHIQHNQHKFLNSGHHSCHQITHYDSPSIDQMVKSDLPTPPDSFTPRNKTLQS